MDSRGLGRRRYIQAVGGGLVFGRMTGIVGAVQTSEDVVLSGKIEAFNKDPIGNRKLYIRHSNEGPYIQTDDSGQFQATVPSNTGIAWALYKSEGSQLHAPVKNGVPHIYPFKKVYTNSSDIDVGTKTVPRAYPVNVRALLKDGSPATDTDFGFGASNSTSTFGSSDYLLSANKDGYLVIKNADFTGIELVGNANISIKIAANDGSTRGFTESVFVDQPMTITAQVGNGVSIKKEGSSRTTTTQETTATEQPTATETSTAKATMTPENQETPTTTQSTTKNEDLDANATISQEPRRGFFSNNAGDTEIEFLTDPFVLTFGGFALSIFGVLQNMLRR